MYIRGFSLGVFGGIMLACDVTAKPKFAKFERQVAKKPGGLGLK